MYLWKIIHSTINNQTYKSVATHPAREHRICIEIKKSSYIENILTIESIQKVLSQLISLNLEFQATMMKVRNIKL